MTVLRLFGVFPKAFVVSFRMSIWKTSVVRSKEYLKSRSTCKTIRERTPQITISSCVESVQPKLSVVRLLGVNTYQELAGKTFCRGFLIHQEIIVYQVSSE